jgi:high-affinity Fe2+/Pb2+ permease
MPSVAAYMGGLILSSGSVYALAMIPAIWLGNLSILLSFKYFYVGRKWNYILSAAVGIAVKVAFIFGGFMLLRLTLTGINSPMPAPVIEKLGTAMGIYQIYTAVMGSFLAFGVVKFYQKKMNKGLTNSDK